jgi:hypothetical protein
MLNVLIILFFVWVAIVIAFAVIYGIAKMIMAIKEEIEWQKRVKKLSEENRHKRTEKN